MKREEIRFCLDQMDLPQQWLCEKIDRSPGAVSLILRGVPTQIRMRREKLLAKMADALREEADRRGEDLDAIVQEFRDRRATGDGSGSEDASSEPPERPGG